jgi:hypothetical protein
MTFPTRLHDPITAPGDGASFRNLTMRHHVLSLCSRATREDRVQYYDRLRAGKGLGHYYLYEDYSPRVSSLPEPVTLDIDNEVCRMDKLQPEDVLRLSFKTDRVPRTVRALEMFWLNVAVTNATQQTLCPCPPFPVRFAYHWLEKVTSRMVLFEGDRSGLFPGVHANTSGQCTIMVRAPGYCGEYILQLTMVQESARWFEDVHPDILQEFPISVGS